MVKRINWQNRMENGVTTKRFPIGVEIESLSEKLVRHSIGEIISVSRSFCDAFPGPLDLGFGSFS
jgi:hypothetical protein